MPRPSPSKVAAALDYLERLKSQATEFGGGVAGNLADRVRSVGGLAYEALTSDPNMGRMTTAEFSEAASRPTPRLDQAAQDFGTISKAIVTQPIQTGQAIVQGEIDRAQEATTSPRAAGEYAGSFIDPMRIAAALRKGGTMRRDIFVGKSSKTWNAKAAQLAEEMEAANIDPKMIWEKTGTFRSPDGKLRQEISDKEANLQDSTYKNFRRNKEGFYTPLNKLLTHTELDNSYPVFNEQRSVRRGNDYDWNASYDGADFGLGVMPKDMMKSGLIHELQHYIQEAEGFSGGGSAKRMVVPKPTEIDVKLMDELKTAFEKLPGGSKERIAAIKTYNKVADPFDPDAQYRLLAGEAEARAVQERLMYDPYLRRKTFPLESYDVPLDKLILSKK